MNIGLMYFHTDCGHIITEEIDSVMVSEGGWSHYTHMYLGHCSVCNDRYPYMKPLDESLETYVEDIVYRLLQTGHQIYLRNDRSGTTTITIRNTQKSSLGAEINHESISEINQYNEDVILKIN